jgi:hypothetical protein
LAHRRPTICAVQQRKSRYNGALEQCTFGSDARQDADTHEHPKQMPSQVLRR